MFPDPETFNPLRWLKPEFPSYREPLTEYPTIINSTQFGYGRRLCQGQTVADEDLLVGIGSIAWLFNIEKPSDGTCVPPAKVQDGIGMNEKASISNEELNTGVNTKESTMEDSVLSEYSHPGSHIGSRKQKPVEPAYKPLEWGNLSQKPADASLDMTILLIAKPIPFSFQLNPRNEERAAKIRKLFNEGVERGDYKDSREYWGPNQGRDKPLGWGKV